MRFLYYMPGANSAVDAERLLAQHGLRKSVEAANLSFSDSKGPDDGGGVLCGHGGRSTPMLFRPDEQTWRECEGGKFWIGYWTDNPPTPETLERDKLTEGHEVDGWTVPLVRPVFGATRLPHTQRLESDGTITHTPLGRYVALIDRVEDIYKVIETESGLEMDESDVYALAGDLLCVNYYIGKWELSAIGATNVTLKDILFASFDLPSFVKFQEELASVG